MGVFFLLNCAKIMQYYFTFNFSLLRKDTKIKLEWECAAPRWRAF